MKVLHVYKNYAPTPGGIETYVRQIARGLARRGGVEATVLVVASGRRGSVEELDGVRVIRAGRWGEVASTPLSVSLARELARTDADLVHLHVPYPVGELGYLLAGQRCPLVVTYHSDVVRQWWARPLYQPMLRLLLRRARAIIATSPPYVRTSPVLRAFADRCQVVPLAVDPSRFQVPPERVHAIQRSWPGPRILFVGRFRRYKGLGHLVAAMRDLPGHLRLIGAGPVEAELRAQVARLGLGNRVEILGGIDDGVLPAHYAACDAFVLPSVQRSEAFGISLLEAMAAGKPVVSTELGTGTSWVNQDGATGLVVPPADTAALGGALRSLIDDPNLARRLGEAGRARVAAEFGEERLLGRIEDVYREALESVKRVW